MSETTATGIERPKQYMHVLANGLTLVAEYIPAVRSAAMTLLVPAGAATDPAEGSGASTVVSEWVLRGAGERDSRALSAYLDDLGTQRGSQAETNFTRFSVQLLGTNLPAILPVYADILRRPHLPEDGFEPSRDLALQQLSAIEDEPASKLSILLRGRHYDYPLGRPTSGIRAHLEAMTAPQLREDFAKRFSPKGAILSVAGCFEWEQLKGVVETAFGDWTAPAALKLAEKKALRGVHHEVQETNQVQIGLAFDTLPDNQADSILVQTTMNVLSGGMGARLFLEVREKQGLCYSINAGYHSFKDRAAIFGYAGTAPDRAQRTLDSFFVELDRLRQGVTAEELARAKTMMKARVIMQGESSGARAGSLAYDVYQRGRTRTLEELKALIESVTLTRVNDYLAANPVKDVTVVTVGPEALKVAR